MGSRTGRGVIIVISGARRFIQLPGSGGLLPVDSGDGQLCGRRAGSQSLEYRNKLPSAVGDIVVIRITQASTFAAIPRPPRPQYKFHVTGSPIRKADRPAIAVYPFRITRTEHHRFLTNAQGRGI